MLAFGDAEFAYPLLAGPALVAFDAWQSVDDFAGIPLQGTFLLDAAGRVSLQDTGGEPTAQID